MAISASDKINSKIEESKSVLVQKVENVAEQVAEIPTIIQSSASSTADRFLSAVNKRITASRQAIAAIPSKAKSSLSNSLNNVRSKASATTESVISSAAKIPGKSANAIANTATATSLRISKTFSNIGQGILRIPGKIGRVVTSPFRKPQKKDPKDGDEDKEKASDLQQIVVEPLQDEVALPTEPSAEEQIENKSELPNTQSTYEENSSADEQTAETIPEPVVIPVSAPKKKSEWFDFGSILVERKPSTSTKTVVVESQIPVPPPTPVPDSIPVTESLIEVSGIKWFRTSVV